MGNPDKLGRQGTSRGSRPAKPYIIERIEDSSGRLIFQESTSRESVFKAGVAFQVHECLSEALAQGTGAKAFTSFGLKNLPFAGKTGTAQLKAPGETQRSHAWITAFAPAEAPRVAVAVMLKGVNAQISAGTGGTLAGPVAKVLLDRALKVVPQ